MTTTIAPLTLPASHFQCLRSRSSACVDFALQPNKAKSPHTPSLSFSASPHITPQEPRSTLAYSELVGSREPFLSTHVKLQLLPKSIPMASCCAEEMLISSSPPFLEHCSISPLAPLPGLSFWGELAGEGGLDGRRTYSLSWCRFVICGAVFVLCCATFVLIWPCLWQEREQRRRVIV